ncbi:MAG: twin transmembrane helix small protein [Gammaproteobacteria bacterium]|nr:twin transmembrane helix small protein [Gammaproteobacteria bacterium]
MLIKIIIVFMLLLILFSLGSGLVYLIKDNGHSERTVKALTVRITLSLILFILLMAGFATGLITPHGIY